MGNKYIFATTEREREKEKGKKREKEKMLIIDILLRQLFEHISATSGF